MVHIKKKKFLKKKKQSKDAGEQAETVRGALRNAAGGGPPWP